MIMLCRNGFLLTRFRASCYYSTRKASGVGKSKTKLVKMLGEEKNAFFVVRKWDLVGVYKNLSDCQAPVGSSVCDPPVSVYKGYSMSKEAEDYMISCGLKNALYSIRAVDLTEELFGNLVACPLQQPHFALGEQSSDHLSKRRFQDVLGSQTGICRLREGLGIATNNVDEYRAMILGLIYALSKGYTIIRVLGDSKLVCMQLSFIFLQTLDQILNGV